MHTLCELRTGSGVMRVGSKPIARPCCSRPRSCPPGTRKPWGEAVGRGRDAFGRVRVLGSGVGKASG